MAKNKEPKMKFKELVKKYEAEFERVAPLLKNEDNIIQAQAEEDLKRLSIDAGYDHRTQQVKAYKRRKFAIFGSIGSVIGSALLACGAFYTLNLGALTVPGTMILSTALVGGAAIVGFGVVPLLMSISAKRKVKKLASVAKESKDLYQQHLLEEQDAQLNVEDTLKIMEKARLDAQSKSKTKTKTKAKTNVNVNGDELVNTETSGIVNNTTKPSQQPQNTPVTDNLTTSFASNDMAQAQQKTNANEQTQESQTTQENSQQTEQDVSTYVDIANNDEITQQSDDESIDDEYSGKSRELTYEELAKEVQGWKFVMKDYKKNPKTKYKCRVELKQYGEKKSGPITSKVLNIVEDDITKFVEQLKNLCDKKSNANKLATARKLCKSAKSMGLKAELRLVMTDMNNPKKTLRTVYKNEEDFVASLETLGRQSAIDNMYYTLSTLNTQQLEVPKTYPTLENQDATQTKVDEQTNSDTTTPNSYVDISKDEIEFEF